jgi:hypothetical protein
MAAKLLLCVSAAGASVARWRGRLADVRRFDPDEAGLQGFAAWLARHPGVPVHVCADSVEEDYRVELLPHASGRDRRELVDRRLKQLYRSTPYAGASLIERDKAGRKDDRWLFAALTDVDLLDPWLQVLEEAQQPLAGIYPVPLSMPDVRARLKRTDANLLVVAKQAAGLRQTFVKDGVFRVSRITTLRSGEGTVSVSFSEEVRNTRMYLNAIGATVADDTVQVLILDQDDTLDSLQRALARGGANLAVERVDRATLVKVLGITQAALVATPDALALHVLGQGAPAVNLAPKTLLGSFAQYRARQGVLLGALGVAALAAVVVAVDLWRAQSAAADAQTATRQASNFRRQYNDVQREFPASPVGSATLKQTVDVADRLRDTWRTPDGALAVVSEALETHPSVALLSLAWRYGRYADGASAFGAGSGSVPPGVALKQVMLVTGEIEPFAGDYRSAIATIRDFADALRRRPSVADVKIVRLPLDASSRQTLTGSTSMRTEQQLAAQFELAITLKDDAANTPAASPPGSPS